METLFHSRGYKITLTFRAYSVCDIGDVSLGRQGKRGTKVLWGRISNLGDIEGQIIIITGHVMLLATYNPISNASKFNDASCKQKN